MIIKKASKSNLNALCCLREKFLIETARKEKVKTSRNNIMIYLSRDYSRYYIAYENNIPLGYIHGTIDPKPQKLIQAFVQEIYVKKGFRKRGIASKLIQKLDRHFKKNKKRPGLNVDKDNKSAINFYKKHDYAILSQEKNIIHMIKKLNVLLIYPPFCTPAAPPYSIASMHSFLINNSKNKINAIDLNIFFHKSAYPEYKRFFRNFKDMESYKLKSDEFILKTRQDYKRNNQNVLDGNKIDLLEKSIKEILKHEPDIVAFSIVYNSQVFYAKAIIDELKKKGIKTIVGGPCSNDKINADARLKNEIELLEFIEGTKISHDNINFSTIPDFSIYSLKDYFSSAIVYPLRTSYSCFYGQCAFCTHHGNSNYAEIDLKLFENTLIKNKSKYAFLIDDMIPTERLVKISKIMKSLNVKWMCQLKPSKDLTKKILQELNDSGLKAVIWGVESASSKVLKLMKKGITKEVADKVLKDSHSAGIKNVVYIMFGFPTETKVEFKETIEFLEKNKD
ncbi:MAG: GNAT family N-acetyltransferase, partial [Candidatus Woesearchaeota archaeon]